MAMPPLSIFIKTAPAFFRPGRAQAGAIGRGDLGFACCNAFVFRRSSGATDRSGLSGKSTVLSICGSCHDVGRLTVGYTPEGWRTVVRMMQNFGAPIPPDQVATVTDYLTRSFPEKPRPAATQIEGTIEVGIKQWPVATTGSRPHDPLAARDGSLWYSGRLANVLGRLDPATGQIREYHLDPMTGPHGLKEDKDGNIWFTGNFAGLIGKLDPKTGSVAE
jgi:virginiamycin B lyase